MSNLFAAIGRAQLKKFEKKFSPKRKKIAESYRKQLNGIKDLIFFDTNLKEYTPHIQPIRIINGKRDLVRKILNQNNIETGIHYKPNHLLSFYIDKKINKLPITEKIYSQILTLPLHPEIKIKDVIKISNIIKKILLKK